MKYIFVDVDVNSIVRVSASTLDEAWKKYIDHRISQLPAEGLEYVERPPNYAEVREDLEHSIFVASEDVEVIEID